MAIKLQGKQSLQHFTSRSHSLLGPDFQATGCTMDWRPPHDTYFFLHPLICFFAKSCVFIVLPARQLTFSLFFWCSWLNRVARALNKCRQLLLHTCLGACEANEYLRCFVDYRDPWWDERREHTTHVCMTICNKECAHTTVPCSRHALWSSHCIPPSRFTSAPARFFHGWPSSTVDLAPARTSL